MHIDGFWLPENLREQVLPAATTTYQALSFDRGRPSVLGGRPAEPGTPGAVTARWPVLDAAAWQRLLAGLRANRQALPRGPAFWDRFHAALEPAARRFSDPDDPLQALALAALPGYTGYSEGMIRASLGGLSMWHLDPFPAAFGLEPTSVDDWQAMPGLPGLLRFYPTAGAPVSDAGGSPWARAARWLRSLGRWRSALGGDTPEPIFPPRDQWPPLDLVVGFGAGNVPGTAVMIAFLALATTLAGGAPPVVVVRNSRREPVLAPLLLGALEEVDPDLVATTAVLVWDHNDPTAEEQLLPRADAANAAANAVVIAAAGDQAIAEIEAAVRRAAAYNLPGSSEASRKVGVGRGRPRRLPARFHAHGHKVSFGAIAREALARGQEVEGTPAREYPALLDVVTLLAALDAAFWDQHGCLSTRVLFVENAASLMAAEGTRLEGTRLDSMSGDYHTPLEVAAALADKLALLAVALPRGAWPRRHLHDLFDRYKYLEQGGEVQVLTGYDDEFLVVVDAREEIGGSGFAGVVNDCQGRAVVVRPVDDLMEIPRRYLSQLPAGHLQSLSVAAGRPRDGGSEREADKRARDERFLAFAGACGACGVTAIRSVGRGAFPQLAYSWDGLIPLDLVAPRRGRFERGGHFTTIEFDDPYAQMLETYALFVRAGMAAASPPTSAAVPPACPSPPRGMPPPASTTKTQRQDR